MASPLDSTYGVWLVSLFLETILYGIGLLQTWLYFQWYPQDTWKLKSIVVLLLIFETLQTTIFFAATYSALIVNFGNAPALLIINWMDSAQLLAGYLSAFTVQLYFAYCIFALDRKHIFITALIVLLALTEIGAGIAQTTVTTILGSFSKLDSTKDITSVQSGSALACDVVITVSLCFVFNKRKTGVRSTNTMIQMLTVNAINRGVLTAVTAGINLVLFLALPGTFYFFLGLMLSSKLYMNSMLATLNTRHLIRDKAYALDWNSIPIGNLPPGGNTTAVTSSTAQFGESTLAQVESGMGKKRAFTDDFI